MPIQKARRYWSRLREYWYYSAKMVVLAYRVNPGLTVVKFAGVVTTAITPLGTAYLLKVIIDEVVLASQQGMAPHFSFFLQVTGAFFCLELLELLCWRVIDYCDRITFLDFGRFLTMKVNEKFSSLDFEYWEDPKLNNLLNKVRETYEWRPNNFASRQAWVLQNLASVISNTLVVLGLGPLYFLLIFVSSIPEFLVGVKFSRSVWSIDGAKGPIKRDYWNTVGYLSNENSLQEIHILGARKKLLLRIDRLYGKFFGYQKLEIRKMFNSRVLASFFTFVVYVFVVGAVFLRAIVGAISVGSLSFYVNRIYGLGGSFKGFFHNLSQNFEDLLYVRDLFTVLNLRSKINQNPKGPKVRPPFRIEFKDVWFKYPYSQVYVLRCFNLVIEPGQKIALIGENGVGKTTIIKLLVRFYDVTKGEILINGQSLKEINLEQWRKNLGALFQDFNRYAYTVRENIHLGDVDKPFERRLFNKAMAKSGADAFVSSLPKGEGTILSKQFYRGSDLSVGQWQKIALSRAFFRNAPVLVLDEPTSAIDARAEYEIFQQIHRFEKGKTVIMISHRFSTVRNADQIYLISKGKIVESGTHERLMLFEGHYAKLFRLQARAYEREQKKTAV